jgi:hypothetical protein
MAERHTITCTVTDRTILFLRMGFYTFYMPYLEKRHGLKELFDLLSHNSNQHYCDRNIIRNYVHTWLGIKGLFTPQHCWNRTLLLYKFLKSAGYNVTLYTGIRKDAIHNTSITGHSWVTIDGRVFDDREKIADEHYITFHYP